MKTLCLVSCVGQKLDHTARAEELYNSPWFKAATQFAKTNYESWAVLSAEHGIVEPEEEVAPYETTLNSMSFKERKTWANSVIYQLYYGDWDNVVILAGEKYRQYLAAWLEDNGFSYEAPMAGLGIGQQLQWLKANNI